MQDDLVAKKETLKVWFVFVCDHECTIKKTLYAAFFSYRDYLGVPKDKLF